MKNFALNILLVGLLFLPFSLPAWCGTFRNSLLLTTSLDPAAITTADLNGDGNPDLVSLDSGYGNTATTLQVHLGRGDGSFQELPAMSIQAGNGCGRCYLTLADVNSDGRLDLIYGANNQLTFEIVVLLGNGDGTFQPPIVSSLSTNGSYPVAGNRLATGDINGDGALDLVASDRLNGYVYVLLGDKTGHFSYTKQLADGDYPSAEYLADLNGDGHLDIVSLGVLGGAATVFLGDGTGSFSTGVRYSAGGATNALLFDDVNADGHPDIVACLTPSTVVILKGKADGTFAGPVRVFQGNAVNIILEDIGDYNGDGIPDIAVSNPAGVRILIGDGNLNFTPMWPAVTGAAGANNFASADFNRDGHVDIALGVEGGISFVFGNGDGTFINPSVFDVRQTVGASTVADFNGDNALDIAVGVAAPLPQLLLGNGKGQFTVATPPTPGPTPPPVASPVVSGDFNGDKKADIEGNLFGQAPNAVALGEGNGTFQAAQTESKGSPILADVNNDRHSDMLSIQQGNGPATLTALLGQTDGTFNEVDTPIESSLAPQIVAVGDVNKDGKSDILLFDYGLLEVWLGNGNGTFTLSQTMKLPSTYLNSNLAALGNVVDVDHDGNADVIFPSVGSTTTSQVAILYGSSGGVLQQPSFVATSHTYTALTVADLNRDGLPDLILSDGSSISTILNRGNRQFGPENHFVAGMAFNTLNVADVNGDGYPDLIAPTNNGTTVVVLMNDPAGHPFGGANVLETLTVTPSNPAYGQPLTFTATVVPDGSSTTIPTGTVAFALDGKVLSNVTLNSGAATFVDSATISSGSHTVSAFYSGDEHFAPTTAISSVTVALPAYSSTAVLTVSPTRALTSQTVRLTATVTSTSPDLKPLGFVTMLDNGRSIGSIYMLAGVANFDTALLSAGTHTLTAAYQGYLFNYFGQGETISPSTSSPVTLTVSSNATRVSLSPSATTAVAGTVVTFTAQASSSSGTPTGGITFMDGTQVLGTTALLGDGSASFNTADLGIGAHSISAAYAANATYAASISAPQTVNIDAAAASLSRVFVSLNLQAPSGNDSATLVARVGAIAGVHVPERSTVIFLDSGTILGRSITDHTGQAALVFKMSALQDGRLHHLGASYSGGQTTAPATSAVFDELLPANGASFHITAFPMQLIAGYRTATLTIQAKSDFQQPVELACISGVPVGYTCKFSPAQVSGGGISVVTLVPVQYTNATSMHGNSVAKSASIYAAFTCLLLCFGKRRKTLLVFLVAYALFLPSGCGGDSSSDSSSKQLQSRVLSIEARTGTGATAALQSVQIPFATDATSN